MIETWVSFKGYEDMYEVSSLGNVRSINYNGTKQTKILSLKTEKSGYLTFLAYKKGIRKTVKVHRAVMLSFKGVDPNRQYVNHINAIKSDNRLENLEWVTHKENIAHAIDNDLRNTPCGKDHCAAKKVDQFTLDGWYVATYDTIRSAAKLTNSDHSRIGHCMKGNARTTNGFKWKEANPCQY